MYEIPHYNVPKVRDLHITCGFGQSNTYLLNQLSNMNGITLRLTCFSYFITNKDAYLLPMWCEHRWEHNDAPSPVVASSFIANLVDFGFPLTSAAF